MDYVRLGRSGLKVSRICLGCMGFGSPDRGDHVWTRPEEESRAVLWRAFEQGINHFDTANIYSDGASEEILGRAIRDMARRDEVVIASKVHGAMRAGPNAGGLSRKAILCEVDASLKRLGTDYIDLYQIHRWDEGCEIEETLKALHDVVKAGKVRYIGASSMKAWQFAKALYVADLHGWTRFISMQNHFNLLYREDEREMMPLCRAESIGLLPWSPLARGRLARAAGEPGDERARTDRIDAVLYPAARQGDDAIVEAVGRIAQARGVTRATVALAWTLATPGVVAPIVGALDPAHVDHAISAVGFALSAEERAALEAPYTPRAESGLALVADDEAPP